MINQQIAETTERLDTRIAVLDEGRMIIGGYCPPFNTRRLDGAYYDLNTYIQVVPPIRDLPQLPVWNDHLVADDSRIGIVLSHETRDDGIYIVAQLRIHPLSDAIWENIVRGEMFWSYDGLSFSDHGYHVGSLIMGGVSIVDLPYWCPSGETGEAYHERCQQAVNEGRYPYLQPINLDMWDCSIAEEQSNEA